MCLEVIARYTCGHEEPMEQDIEMCEEGQERGSLCEEPEYDYLDFDHHCPRHCGGPPEDDVEPQVSQTEWQDDEEGLEEALQESMRLIEEDEDEQVRKLLEETAQQAEVDEDDAFMQALEASKASHAEYLRQWQPATNDDEEEEALQATITATLDQAPLGDFDNDEMQAVLAVSREQFIAGQLRGRDAREFVPEAAMRRWNNRPGLDNGTYTHFAPQPPADEQPVEYIKRTFVYKSCGHKVDSGDSAVPRGPRDSETREIPAQGLCNRCHAKARAAANREEGEAGPLGPELGSLSATPAIADAGPTPAAAPAASQKYPVGPAGRQNNAVSTCETDDDACLSPAEQKMRMRAMRNAFLDRVAQDSTASPGDDEDEHEAPDRNVKGKGKGRATGKWWEDQGE